MHVPSSLGNLAAYSQFLFKEPTCERSCCRMSPCGGTFCWFSIQKQDFVDGNGLHWFAQSDR